MFGVGHSPGSRKGSPAVAAYWDCTVHDKTRWESTQRLCTQGKCFLCRRGGEELSMQGLSPIIWPPRKSHSISLQSFPLHPALALSCCALLGRSAGNFLPLEQCSHGTQPRNPAPGRCCQQPLAKESSEGFPGHGGEEDIPAEMKKPC